VPPRAAAHAQWAAALKEGNHAQLSYDGGWWDVLVLRPPAAPGGNFKVMPLLYQIEHNVGAALLRPKPEWAWDVGSKQWRARGTAYADADDMEADE